MKYGRASNCELTQTKSRSWRRRALCTAIPVAITLVLTTAAQAQPVGTVTRYAASGHPLKLTFFSATNPDCSSIGAPTIRLSTPAHGHATVTRTTDFPSFPPTNIRSECNRRRVPGAVVYYVPQRGYIGEDSFQAETIFPNGVLWQRTYNIIVR